MKVVISLATFSLSEASSLTPLEFLVTDYLLIAMAQALDTDELHIRSPLRALMRPSWYLNQRLRVNILQLWDSHGQSLVSVSSARHCRRLAVQVLPLQVRGTASPELKVGLACSAQPASVLMLSLGYRHFLLRNGSRSTIVSSAYLSRRSQDDGCRRPFVLTLAAGGSARGGVVERPRDA